LLNGDGLNGYCIQLTGITYTRWAIRNCKLQLVGQPARPAIAGPGLTSQLTVPTAATATASLAAGNLGSGLYRYVVTFVNANGETSAGAEATTTTDGTHQQVALTAIPTGAAGTTSRKVYRTSVAGAAGTNKLLTTIADNSTTTYTDNTADGSLGAQVPPNNSTGLKEVAGSSQIADNEFMGGDAVDFSGMMSCSFLGNKCRNVFFDANSNNLRIEGNRFAHLSTMAINGTEIVVTGNGCGSGFLLQGSSIVFVGNVLGAGDVTADVNSANCYVGLNRLDSSGVLVDNSTGSSNRLLDNMEGFSGFNGQNGVLAPTTRGWTGLLQAASALTAIGSRFVAPRAMAVTHLSFAVSTNGSAGHTVDGAIYSSDGQTKLGSTGSLDLVVNTTGAKRIPLTATVQLKAGVTYYIVLSFSNGTQQIMFAQPGTGFAGELFATSVSTYALTGQLGTWMGISVTSGAAGVSPTTLTGAARGTGPVVGVRES
jgi:hypothetical protein